VTFVVVEYAVECVDRSAPCGVLGEHLSAQESDSLTSKHVRQTKHATAQRGAPTSGKGAP
jgi:hypothetical protein